METLIHPIPDHLQHARAWQVSVNGVTIEYVTNVVVSSKVFGTLAYGLTPDGHDGWSFHEAGGGGSVIIPYVLLENDLHIGLIRQHRRNQGGMVLNLPRGFLDLWENHQETASRELHEEMGLQPQAARMISLGGEPANPNSAFFETPHPEEGTHFFGLELQAHVVERRGLDLVLRPGLVRSDPEARARRTAEFIESAVFLPWFEAAQLADMFTNAAVARLLAHLRSTVQDIMRTPSACRAD